MTQNSLPWTSHHILVQTALPVIAFTSPLEVFTAQPLIQLKGFSSTDLGAPLQYDALNQAGKTNASGEGLVNDRYYDQALGEFTTNFFTCYDIKLSPGTNTIVLRGKDLAGFSFVTNFVCVFSTVGHTNPPVFSIAWPRPGMEIGNDNFTVRGMADDPTATLTGQIVANGITNTFGGSIGRNGYFEVEYVPIALGVNELTLNATDVAGNSYHTNFTVIGNKEILTMDPVVPDSQLWQPTIAVVTGQVHPIGQGVWINGVQAEVKADGTWRATNVPVISSPGVGSTANFELTSVSPDEMSKGAAKLNQNMSTQASLGTNTIILNASSPACGVFNLHLAETAGHSFVLQASTNMVEWLPILTNSNPNATFDYTDTNANNYYCRFFRVVPLP